MINVKDAPYGAVGDGVVDDAASIQAALNTGGWVYVPNGVYRLATLPLECSAGTRLTVSPGAYLVRDASSTILVNGNAGCAPTGYGGHGDILIEGGVWDMRGAAHPTYAGALAIGHAEGVTIRDLTVLDVPGWHGVELNACRTVRIRDCRFLGFTHNGDRGNSEAIQIDAATGAGAFPWFGVYDGTPCTDVQITGCTFGPSTTEEPWPCGVGSHNGGDHTDISISGCVFNEPGDTAVRAYSWINAMIGQNFVHGGAGDGITTTHNTFYTSLFENQIFDVGRNGVLIDGGSQVTVRGNTVVGSGNTANNVYDGIRLLDVTLGCVTDNRVRRRSTGNAARHGLYLDAASSSCQRHGNDLRASGVSAHLQDLSSAASSGIDLI